MAGVMLLAGCGGGDKKNDDKKGPRGNSTIVVTSGSLLVTASQGWKANSTTDYSAALPDQDNLATRVQTTNPADTLVALVGFPITNWTVTITPGANEIAKIWTNGGVVHAVAENNGTWNLVGNDLQYCPNGDCSTGGISSVSVLHVKVDAVLPSGDETVATACSTVNECKGNKIVCIGAGCK
jgi:hypothetical protein